MLSPMMYSSMLMREIILEQVALDVGEAIVETAYGELADHDMTDTADLIGERVKDNVWCNIPGEQSS